MDIEQTALAGRGQLRGSFRREQLYSVITVSYTHLTLPTNREV